ncbi:MAG: hypothetical protein AB1756_02455, partial [Acidobacteriota bacterium]
REDYFLSEDLGYEERPDQTGREIRHTDSGRTVHGGGGITPDIIIKDVDLSKFMSKLIRDNIFFEFAVTFVADASDLDRTFVVDNRILSRFKDFLEERKVEFNEEDFTTDDQILKTYLKANIFSIKFGRKEEAKIFAENNPLIQKAIDLFPEAVKLASAPRNN